MADAIDITQDQTWYVTPHGDKHNSPRIVTVGLSFDGTLGFDFDNALNANDAISSATSVTFTAVAGEPAVTAANIRLSAGSRKVLFDTPALATAGQYDVKAIVVSVNAQTLPMTGRLVVV